MSSPTPPPPATPPRRRTSALKMMLWLLVVPTALIASYFAIVLNWNYSTGERAGWVQKLSRKGWLCKTWEGEMAMVSMPGAIPEKFLFTVRDDAVADNINKVMGKRVTLHYEEKVGLPTSCFGETRHFVNRVIQVDDIPLVPGVVVPTLPATKSPPQPIPVPSTPSSAAPGPPASPASGGSQPAAAPSLDPPPPQPAKN